MADPTRYDDSPVETFKLSTAAAVRAIAEKGDVAISYGKEPPGFTGNRVRLPVKARSLTVDEAARVRMRGRCHGVAETPSPYQDPCRADAR